MTSHKITFKLVRSFGIGFVIASPTLNGMCVEVQLGCLVLQVWNRGKSLLGFENYWNG